MKIIEPKVKEEMNVDLSHIDKEAQKLDYGILFNDMISKYFSERIKYLTEKYDLVIPIEFT